MGCTCACSHAPHPSTPLQTQVSDTVLALQPFQKKLLAGVGKYLRVYDLGKRKLLRKCENKVRTGVVYTPTVHGG